MHLRCRQGRERLDDPGSSQIQGCSNLPRIAARSQDPGRQIHCQERHSISRSQRGPDVDVEPPPGFFRSIPTNHELQRNAPGLWLRECVVAEVSLPEGQGIRKLPQPFPSDSKGKLVEVDDLALPSPKFAQALFFDKPSK